VAWRRGEAFWRMRQLFALRKDEVKRLGLKVKDEKLTWTKWLELETETKPRYPRNTVSR
jgi:hypothetical protein